MKAKKVKKSVKKKTGKAKKSGFFRSACRFCFKWGLVLGLWGIMILGGILLWFAAELPNITKSMVFERRPTVIIKDANGEIVDRYGDVKGKIVDVTALPPHITQAVLAIEDRRFYQHWGIDAKGIARAFIVNIQQGGFVQGGSTITQQLAKNLFLSRDRTLKRKIQELILAIQLERELTKDEILSAYLNRVYLGNGAYGIDAAARVYFNKSAQEINIREAATIAGLLKAPSRFAPSNNPEKSAARTKTVLRSMVDAGYIEQHEIVTYLQAPPAPRRKPSSGQSVRYFTDYIVSQIDDLIGEFSDDIIVETTLDSTIQEEMEQAITRALLKYSQEREVEQGAGIVMRLDGSIKAMVGGKDYNQSEFNRVTESRRPPGSSFKPFVYLSALENGWYINSIITDEPIESGRYRPRNFGHKYYGDVTLFEALTLSLNTVAVNLMRAVGPDTVIHTTRRLGITADLEPNLSTALGSSGVPMLQMTTAYATLGRGGLAVEPYSIVKIVNKDGDILYQREQPKKNRRVVEQHHIIQLTAMMQSVIQNGTGRAAAIPYPAAGKTGTSQDFRDAWFIGFTTKYAGGIWFGNDDNSPTKRLTGGSAPAQVWRDVMLKAQAKAAPQYTHFSTINSQENGNLDELLDRVLKNAMQVEENQNAHKGLFGWFNRPSYKRPNAPSHEFTPLGRHQWDLND